MNRLGLTEDEEKILRKLDTPKKIQDFLNEIQLPPVKDRWNDN